MLSAGSIESMILSAHAESIIFETISPPKVMVQQFSFAMCLPTAKVGKFCKLACKLKFARFLSWLKSLNT
jgi:hypothetical protein